MGSRRQRGRLAPPGSPGKDGRQAAALDGVSDGEKAKTCASSFGAKMGNGKAGQERSERQRGASQPRRLVTAIGWPIASALVYIPPRVLIYSRGAESIS